jgi:hypothetical protein
MGFSELWALLTIALIPPSHCVLDISHCDKSWTSSREHCLIDHSSETKFACWSFRRVPSTTLSVAGSSTSHWVSACPVYEALSYVWGDATQTSPMTLNGASYPITKNLESAIRHLRRREGSRTLWVDAVGINQLDLDERSSQVLRMKDINIPQGDLPSGCLAAPPCSPPFVNTSDWSIAPSHWSIGRYN